MIPSGYTRSVLRSVLAATAGCFLAAGAWAAPADEVDNADIVMFLHVVPKQEVKRVNCFHHGVEGHGDVVVHGDVSSDPEQPAEYFAFLLIAGFDQEVGMTAVQFGIAYDSTAHSGVDVVGWQDCAALEWHADDWPGAGTGNLLTWNMNDDCQKQEPVVVGMFELRVYGPDRLVITPRPVDGKAMIAACSEPGSVSAPTAEFKPENLGFAGFGDKAGYNPWDPKQNLLKIRERGFGKSKD